jgi:hypothetical protein
LINGTDSLKFTACYWGLVLHLEELASEGSLMSLTARIQLSASARVILCALVVCGLAGPAAQNSFGAIFNLVDGNSSALFDTSTPANNYRWFVDGVNQLSQQAFWYRVGNVAEQSVHTLPIGVQGTTDPNFDGNPNALYVRYNGAGFHVETQYLLDGGLPGSNASDMSEQISITNTSGAPLDFHFFQYANFDLQNTPGGDTAVFTNPNTVDQNEGVIRLTETVVTPVPSHREIAFFNTTLVKLTDGVATTLSDAPPIGTVAGPGDMTWSYQWDIVIPPNATFQISKDKNLNAIPEPATFVLLSSAVGLLHFLRRKR